MTTADAIFPAPTPPGPAGVQSLGLDALAALARSAGLDPGVPVFYFLRHGETAGNASRTFQPLDEPLNAAGHEQARVAASLLRQAEFEHIVASDLPRAWLTAGKVAAATRRPVHAEQGLRERFFGDLIGTPNVALDWHMDPPGGETLQQFVTRAVAGLNRTLARGATPLVVSHGGVLHVLRSGLGLELTGDLVANAMPLRFELTAMRWSVTAVG
ncbi:MAG TPA: histidine phosphatase family protein [Candidatus Cybelea sp.]|nr:histidine phosphatase family protein [Candidatus Cybelea sp.]